jgi:hypothetical protein
MHGVAYVWALDSVISVGRGEISRVIPFIRCVAFGRTYMIFSEISTIFRFIME